MASRNAGGLPPVDRQRVSPQVTTGGVGARTHYTEISNLFGNITDKTTDLAQEIANEEAALKGAEEAIKNPNRQPRAAITEAERAKKEAFLIGSEQLLTSTASQSFKSIADSVTLNGQLKPDSYERYKTLADAEMKGILETAPAEIRPQLTMKMADFSQGYGQEVLGKVNQYNTNIGVANFYDSYSNFTSEAESAYARGNLELGNAAIKNAMINVEGAWQMGWLSPEKYHGLKEGLQTGAIVGYYNNQYRAALRSGQGDEYLRQLALNRPEGMSDEQFRAVASSLSGVQSLFNEGRAKANTAVYDALEELQIRGQLTEENLNDAKDEGAITPKQYNRLLNKVINENVEEKTLDSQWNSLIEGSYLPSSVSEANDIYTRQRQLIPINKKTQFEKFGIKQTEPDVYYAAKVASKFTLPLASFKTELHNLVASQNPEQQQEAIKAFKALGGNEFVLKGMDKQSYAFMQGVTRLENHGISIAQAIDRSNKINFGIDKLNQDVIQDEFDLNTKKWDSDGRWRTLSAEALGVDEANVPDTYVALFKSGVRDYFNFERDINSAVATTAKELSTRFSKNTINNDGTAEFYPINLYYEQNQIPRDIYLPATNKALELEVDKILEEYKASGADFEKVTSIETNSSEVIGKYPELINAFRKYKDKPIYKYNGKFVVPSIINPGLVAPPDESGTNPTYAIELRNISTGETEAPLLRLSDNEPYLFKPLDVNVLASDTASFVLAREENKRKNITNLITQIGESNASSR